VATIADEFPVLPHGFEVWNVHVQEAHAVLERLETTLTLAEAKLALTQHIIAIRHHEQQP
jgi:hypothetical protein